MTTKDARGATIVCFCVLLTQLVCKAAPMHEESVIEKAVTLPVAYDVDIVVAGGSVAGVEAACAAAQQGARVLLLDSRSYLGYDLCATQRLWLEEDETPATELTTKIFAERRIATPYQVKRALDQALIANGVQFLTGCYATDVLVQADGTVGGMVMSNRSGRQIVKTKVIIDATKEAALTRTTNAWFKPFTTGTKEVVTIVIGGNPRPSGSCEKIDGPFASKKKDAETYTAHHYTLRIDMPDNSFRSLCHAHNRARGATYGEGVVDYSEVLIYFPEDTIIPERQTEGVWAGADKVDLGSFRPRGVQSLYVLSAYAGLDNRNMKAAMRATQAAVIGKRIGVEAAEKARRTTGSGRLVFPGEVPSPGRLDVQEAGKSHRFADCEVLSLPAHKLPVLAEFDVVVIGGGTSGAPAAIAAVRNGAKTLVIEYIDELGGVSTAGMIGGYWYGNRTGFTAEIDHNFGERWNVVERSEWLRTEIVQNTGEIWFGSFGSGAVVSGKKVVGVVVCTPRGRGIVRARTVIDSTGNATIAAAAGTDTQFSISASGILSTQMGGYPHRNLGDSYNNNALSMIDDTDVFDIWHMLLFGRQTWHNLPGDREPYDVGQLINTRERQRTVGEYMLTTTDILTARTYPDTICHMKSNFDAASLPDSLLLLVRDMKGPVYDVDFPFRCLIPKGLDGILVTGLGASVERDAMTLTRMQPDLQNQGYAAGLAASMAAEENGSVRKIRVKSLQERLAAIGIVRERVLTDKDSFPLSADRLTRAVKTLARLTTEIDHPSREQDPTFSALADVLSHPEQTVPLLRAAYASAVDPEARLSYARVLACLGDDTGVDTLIQAVKAEAAWGEGYGLTEHRATHNTFTRTDRLVMALGFSRSPKALPILMEKLKLLDKEHELSHFKAMYVALRLSKRAELADPLAALLDQRGMHGWAQDTVFFQMQDANRRTYEISRRGTKGGRPRDNRLNCKFRELITAALLYQCGDKEGKGRAILEEYTRDVHGHFANYARTVLDGVVSEKRIK